MKSVTEQSVYLSRCSIGATFPLETFLLVLIQCDCEIPAVKKIFENSNTWQLTVKLSHSIRLESHCSDNLSMVFQLEIVNDRTISQQLTKVGNRFCGKMFNIVGIKTVSRISSVLLAFPGNELIPSFLV